MVKNPPANKEDPRNTGCIPASGRPPGVGNATHSIIFAWKVPQKEKPGGLQSMGPKESHGTERILEHMAASCTREKLS